MRQNQNSGQILLVTAFIMASLLLSAQLYVLDVGKTSGEMNSYSLNDFMSSVKLGCEHVVAGSLANISNGGSSSLLELNLRGWAEFVSSQYLGGKNVLNFTLEEAAPYSSGVRLLWGANGYGASSAHADFAHTLVGPEADVDMAYSINVTTALLISSTSRMINETARQINLTIEVLDEAGAALAMQVTVYYNVSGTWLIPSDISDYTLLDYGNGTYIASFIATGATPEVEVSVHATDFRGVYVQANVTSTEV
jgi:hypothetical protein